VAIDSTLLVPAARALELITLSAEFFPSLQHIPGRV